MEAQREDQHVERLSGFFRRWNSGISIPSRINNSSFLLTGFLLFHPSVAKVSETVSHVTGFFWFRFCDDGIIWKTKREQIYSSDQTNRPEKRRVFASSNNFPPRLLGDTKVVRSAPTGSPFSLVRREPERLKHPS